MVKHRMLLIFSKELVFLVTNILIPLIIYVSLFSLMVIYENLLAMPSSKIVFLKSSN